jgi:hypothetical protein
LILDTVVNILTVKHPILDDDCCNGFLVINFSAFFSVLCIFLAIIILKTKMTNFLIFFFYALFAGGMILVTTELMKCEPDDNDLVYLEDVGRMKVFINLVYKLALIAFTVFASLFHNFPMRVQLVFSSIYFLTIQIVNIGIFRYSSVLSSIL